MRLFGRQRPTANENQEFQVVAAILAACEDPRSRQLYEQFARAKKRNRTDSANGFVVEPGPVDEDLRVDLPSDVASNWITVKDVTSGRALEFRVVLRAGGTFGGLEARTADGAAFPSPWGLDGVELAQAARGALTLPPAP